MKIPKTITVFFAALIAVTSFNINPSVAIANYSQADIEDITYLDYTFEDYELPIDYDTDNQSASADMCVETPVDEYGGHYGMHYDKDDTSEYHKVDGPHCGYHFDDDTKNSETKSNKAGFYRKTSASH